MDLLVTFTDKLRHGLTLEDHEAHAAATLLAQPGEEEAKAEFLRSLSSKGESESEVAAFARTFRELARPTGMEAWAADAVDIVGTGGDHFGSFNISTTAAFLVAAGGNIVIKHGNRAITSQSGSSDFLSVVGIPPQAPLEIWQEALAEIHFAFLYAPTFHPAFREIMPVRKKLAAEGVRTIFNLLGPLINPAHPAHSLIGVFAETWCRPLALALNKLNIRRGMVVHGRFSEAAPGVDELTAAGPNRMVGTGDLQGWDRVVEPETLGLTCCQPEVLKGGTPEENGEMLWDFATGIAPRGLADTIHLNAGAAFWVLGRANCLQEGVALSREIVESGQLRRWLARTRAFFLKRLPSDKSFST